MTAWRQRCRARNRAGYRCKRWALAGAHVCKLHGAGSPQARKSAAVRLLELFHTGADVVQRELPALDPHARAQLGVAAMRIALAAGVVPGTATGPRDQLDDEARRLQERRELGVMTDREIADWLAALETCERIDRAVAERLAAAPPALPAAPDAVDVIDVTPEARS